MRSAPSASRPTWPSMCGSFISIPSIRISAGSQRGHWLLFFASSFGYRKYAFTAAPGCYLWISGWRSFAFCRGDTPAIFRYLASETSQSPCSDLSSASNISKYRQLHSRHLRRNYGWLPRINHLPIGPMTPYDNSPVYLESLGLAVLLGGASINELFDQPSP